MTKGESSLALLTRPGLALQHNLTKRFFGDNHESVASAGCGESEASCQEKAAGSAACKYEFLFR